MNVMRHICMAIALAFCGFSLCAKLKPAPDRLITKEQQVQGITVDGYVISTTAYNATERIIDNFAATPITVDFSENPVTLSPGRGLVVYLGRYSDDGAPTVLRVSGHLKGGSEYTVLGYAYLLFRGVDRAKNGSVIPTHEFSNRIYGNGEYDSFKLDILEVSSGTQAKFFKFNLFAIDNDQAYPAGRIDPLHIDSEYYYDFYDFSYVPNNGILEKRNHYYPNADYPEVTPWGEETTFIYEGNAYELPSFKQKNGKQIPHVTEQTLYAMPGDMISLSPYYDLPTSGNYKEKFSHWYGYVPNDADDNLQEQQYHHVTDSRGNRLLDFLIDPTAISLTADNGYFAGTSFPTQRWKYTVIDEEQYFVIGNANDLIQFAWMVGQSGGNQATNAIVVNDIDCHGRTINKIAGDWDLKWSKDIAYTGKFNGNGHTIKNFVISEPTNYHTGFFGGVGAGAEIRNLNLIDFSVSSLGRTGGLIGEVFNTGTSTKPITIENVFVNAEVKVLATEDAGIGQAWQMNISQGGGLIGLINEEQTINLKNVGFVGTVTGGYGDDSHNGAFIGYAKGSNVDFKNCYADTYIDKYGDGQVAVGHDASSQISVDANTFVNIRSGVENNEISQVSQENFTDFTENPLTSITTGSTNSIFTGKHLICVNLSENWPQVCAYVWGNNQELFGKWPGKSLSNRNNYAAYLVLDDNEWATLSTFNDWNIIINNGYSNKTADSKFGDIALNDFFYDNIELKKQDHVKLEESKKRTILLHNPIPGAEYSINIWHGDNVWYGVTNGVLTLDGDSYCFFNVPSDIEGGKYAIDETYNRTTRVIVQDELKKETTFIEYTPAQLYKNITETLKWTDTYNGMPLPEMDETVDFGERVYTKELDLNHATRWYGTEATFYQPRKAEYAPDAVENLKLEEPDYYIAVDFAHEFNSSSNNYNIDYVEEEIHEPILNFRHIFHIKDGKTFADAYTTTKADNEKYLKANSRAVTARAGKDFQIRLSTQIPCFEWNSTYSYAKTNFYYKKAQNSYARVPRVALEITAPDGTVSRSEFLNYATQTVDKGSFFFDATVQTQGVRKYPDFQNDFCADENTTGLNADYRGGNGNSKVYRTLFCKGADATAGVWKVRLMALESDGVTRIRTTDGLAPLYLDEYEITFVPDSEASVVTEEVLAGEDYRTHRSDYLEQEDVAGAPAVVVDFDEYRTFETSPYNPDEYFTSSATDSKNRPLLAYKWPMLWNLSTYSFGYGGYYNYDYNEYILANHSSQVMYRGATEKHENEDGTIGLYDRLYYDTYSADPDNVKTGYFYYVNAASDPGVMSRLRINNLCPGSTVAVSAWVSEMSYENEVANLLFNFVAVDENNNREIVHSFVTGYIDNIDYGSPAARLGHEFDRADPAADPNMANHGKWVHVYYSFIPDLSSIRNIANIDHYELELENNCVSSYGADYAVDDIRAYIISPQLTARQLNPVCDANQSTIGIRISSRFDKLLDSNGLLEATADNGVTPEELSLYFAVLDKKKYDELYAEFIKEGSTLTKEEMVRRSVIYFDANTGNNAEKNFCTSIVISTDYDSESIEDYDEKVFDKAMRYTSPTSGVRYIRTNILPSDKDLRPGKDYYIVLYARYKNSDGTLLPEPGYADFAVTDDPCARYAVITLQGSGIIKVDGIAYTNGEPIDVCAGQSPVVQVDLKMMAEGEEIDIPMPAYSDYDNATAHYYDWFNGPIEEFMEHREDGQSYYDLIYTFRNGESPHETSGPSGKGNIDADELPEPAEGESDIYAPLRELIEDGRLVLHASSYVYPPLEYDANPDHIYLLTAMPIIPGPDDEEGYKVCSQPNEIRLRVQDNSPLMFDGFSEIEYPETDVPVRVGLRQLRSVRELDPLTIEDRSRNRLGINYNVNVGPNLRKLEIPLRGLLSYKGEGVDAEMTMAGNRNEEADPYVYLVETNDPAYISLDKHPMDEVAIKNSLLPIGMVDDLSAKTGEENNKVTIVFDKNMQFSEGYYYRVRFAYDEIIPTEVEGYCEGHVVFTIKVVPEYQKWTGAASRNWNNDSNWSRVTPEDILLPTDDEKIADFTVNAHPERKHIAIISDAEGNETRKPAKILPSNRRSYVPLDFTKALVMQMANDTTAGYPFMFAATGQNISTLRGQQEWNNSSIPTLSPASPVNLDPTLNIEYDMVSFDVNDGPLAMRPWYANTCEQIHFNHGAEMVHQENFIFGKNYQKAWVDIEMTGDRWYTLASPLQGVLAGDMYTKTIGGMQDNELFTDITFNNNEYGRYEPAVYQRGWNKAEAKTYFLGDGTHDSKSAAVRLNWSRVYNDVEEAYSPGIGYSIRTATDGIKDPDENKTIRFRLPKADDAYSYFDSADNTEEADNTYLNRNGNRHALTPFTDGKLEVLLNVGSAGNYFLAGNPFMARIKMSEFLEANNSVIEPAYWIMTSDRQEAILWDERSDTFIGTDMTENTEGTIAPMQGFFVKAKESGTSLTLTFTPEMIDEGDIDANVLLRAPRSGQPRCISVSAIGEDGETVSRALIRLAQSATAALDATEDVALLIDNSLEAPATVYTVAAGKALAINSLDAIVETEVGLLATEEAVNIIRFEGIRRDDGLRLLDTATGMISELHEGLEIEVKGAAAGRFYIIRPAFTPDEAEMAMVLRERTVSIVSTTDGITARVYTPAGLNEGEWSTDGTLLRFDLEEGIHIVDAIADGERLIRKFIVK